MSRRHYNWALAIFEDGDITAWEHADGATAADLDEVLGWAEEEEEDAQVALVVLIGDCEDRADWFPADTPEGERPRFDDGGLVPVKLAALWQSRQR